MKERKATKEGTSRRRSAAGRENAPETTQTDAPDEDAALNNHYLEGTIGYAIRRAQIAVFSDLYRTIGELSVTPTQFSVLSLVADNPGMTQAAIAAALGVERPRIVPVIDALEARGVATRVTSAADRRAREIHLTREGRALLRELKRRFATHQARMVARLQGDPEIFLGELWRLARPE